MMDQNKVGNLIKELRKKNGLTQEKFALNMVLLIRLSVSGKMVRIFRILLY